MGVNKDRVFRWMTQTLGATPSIRSRLESINSRTNEIVTKPTLYPLPSYINVTLKLQNVGLRIFGNTKEDCLFTSQLFSGLFTGVSAFSLGDGMYRCTLINLVNELLEEDKSAKIVKYTPTQKYNDLHKLSSTEFGKVLGAAAAGIDFDNNEFHLEK